MNGYKSPELKTLKMNVETPPGDKTGESRPVSRNSSWSNSTRRSRSTPRSKGIGLNLAVSPSIPTSTPRGNETNKTTVSLAGNGYLEPKSPGEQVRYDANEQYDLDISTTQIEAWDIDEQLRLLALKEMGLVELKDSINNMNTVLKKQQDELHKLRQIIQKSLYKELTVSSTKRERKNSNPREEAIANTRNRRRTLSNSLPPNLTSTSPEPGPKTPDEPGYKNGSKIWNGFQKPLNLLQQFDTMLQTEFEKSLIPQNQQVTGRVSEDSISTISTASPLKHKSMSQISPIKANFDKLFDHTGDKDDMFQTVSTSLWSFVHDVKANVLSSLTEEQENELGKEFSSPINDAKLNNSDYEDEFENIFEEDDDDKIDLSMYTNLRKPSK